MYGALCLFRYSWQDGPVSEAAGYDCTIGNDTLFVLGDVIDRNPDGIEILKDLLARKNVELFLGNHEWFSIAV